MRIYLNRPRLRITLESLFMKASKGSRGMGVYVKSRYIERLIWNLKGRITKVVPKNKKSK